jgi:hypothetical protein
MSRGKDSEIAFAVVIAPVLMCWWLFWQLSKTFRVGTEVAVVLLILFA